MAVTSHPVAPKKAPYACEEMREKQANNINMKMVLI